MVGRVRDDHDHIARDGGRPAGFGVRDEAHGARVIDAVRVREDDGLELGEVGRGHAAPLLLRYDHGFMRDQDKLPKLDDSRKGTSFSYRRIQAWWLPLCTQHTA